MSTNKDIRPISYIKANAAKVLTQVNETHRPIYVTQNGEAKAVLLDTESYEKMRNALGLFKLMAQGERDITDNKVISQDELFSELDGDLENTDHE